MKILSPALMLLILSFASCAGDKNNPADIAAAISNDPFIGKAIINTGEGNGKHVTYFAVHGGDTSDLRYNFVQLSHERFEITIHRQNESAPVKLSYREEMNELERVLHEAAKDFDLRSMTKIWDIPLLATGDLAIALTKQLPPGFKEESITNLYLKDFLMKSQLTHDLDSLLRPYNKKIESYVIEKAGFLDSASYFKVNKIETARPGIPARILDAQLWPVITSSLRTID